MADQLMDVKTPDTEPDWKFRAEYLDQMANYNDRKADEFYAEAQRFRGLAEQARMLARMKAR